MKLFNLLQQIAEQAQQHATPLPQPDKIREIWTGISFCFHEIELLVPLSEISEIAPCPNFSLLPGVKPWARGVANIRGNLITVIDLAAFLGLRSPSANNKGRVLVINQPGLMAGILVDEIHGLRHYDYETQIEQVMIDEPILAPYVAGGFIEKEQQRIVLSLSKLTQSSEFINIAA